MNPWKLICRLFAREPDKVIGVGYLERWHVIPRNRYFNVYLHKFSGSDDDRALHDHPWCSLSFLLHGELVEVTNRYHQVENVISNRWRIKRWRPVFRSAEYPYRLILPPRCDAAWTLFITGPRKRHWGFLCPQGWRHWSDFTDVTGLRTGRGCD